MSPLPAPQKRAIGRRQYEYLAILAGNPSGGHGDTKSRTAMDPSHPARQPPLASQESSVHLEAGVPCDWDRGR